MAHNSISRVVFITGASTGFGREIAVAALKSGYRVVATARNPESLVSLRSPECEDRLLCLPLDVTKPAQINDAVTQALAQFGAIDVLMNNAGYGVVGAVEEFNGDELRQQFETNVFGAIAVIQAVLPSMRQRRSGHIITISSVAGFVCRVLGFGVYSASKHALEGGGQGLAKEVQPFGIHVTMVNPGPFRTDFMGRSLHVVEQRIADYDASVHAALDAYQQQSGHQDGDPRLAAEAIMKLISMQNPPFNLPLGKISYEVIRNKLHETLHEMKQFESLGLPTDYVRTSSRS